MAAMLIFAAFTAVTSFVGNSAKARNASRMATHGRNMDALNASASRKASGFETQQQMVQQGEERQATSRKALQIQGHAKAAFSGKGLTGNSVAVATESVLQDADTALAGIDYSIETKQAADRMAAKSQHEADLYKVNSFDPTSLGAMVGTAVLQGVSTYVAGEAGKP